MQIGVLSHNISPYCQRRLLDAAHKRGHTIHFIQLSYCYTDLTAVPPKVYTRGNQNFENLEAILPRINTKHTPFGIVLLRQLEQLGLYTLNSSSSISLCRDKPKTLQHLSKKNLPAPMTGYADSSEESERLIELIGGPPLIVRVLESAQGKKTVFAETQAAALSIINAFKQLHANILVQEFIEEAKGRDIRCVVVGKRVICAIERCIEPGSRKQKPFAIHHQKVKLDSTERKLAVKAARAMKLNLATVDLIRSRRGPLILDIDPSPNIEFMERNTGIDISSAILEFMERDINDRGLTPTIE